MSAGGCCAPSSARYWTASSVRCDRGTRLKSADSDDFTHAKDERASDGTQKLEPGSKCHRRGFPSSNLARNFANWLSDSEQAGFARPALALSVIRTAALPESDRAD